MPRLRDSKGLFIPSTKNYEYLLDFESIKNWEMTLGSAKTKDLYYRTMHFLLRWDETKNRDVATPDDLVKLSDSQAVDLIRRFSFKYQSSGKNAMAELVKTIFKSFYSANGRELRSPLLKMRKVPKTSKTYDRLVPLKDQVYALADSTSNLRDRALILTLWQSGLRNSTLRNLKVGHVKARLLKNEVPLKIDVTPDIDKSVLKEQYYTFIDNDAVDALCRYLRTRDGIENLDESEPLFLANLAQKRKMSDMALGRAIKRAAKRARLDPKRIWAHCLRAAFYNMLVGKVDDVEREFMFGHVMGVRSHYFAPQWIQKLRSAYSSVGWDRTGSRITREEVRTEVIGALMGKIGDAELAPIAQKLGISSQQIRSMIRRIGWTGSDGETEALLETERTERNVGWTWNNCESKLISEEELCACINDGWDIVKELTNGKIVVKRPKAS